VKSPAPTVPTGVLAQLAAPTNRVPLLVAGAPQHGVAAHSQVAKHA